MDQKLVEKIQKEIGRYNKAPSGSKQEEDCLATIESYSSQLLAGAITEADLKTVFKFSPPKGSTEREARRRLDDLNIQKAKDELELCQAIKEYNQAVDGDGDKKAALAKLEESCLRIVNEAKSPAQVKRVLLLADKCRPEVLEKAMDKMGEFLLEALDSLLL